MFWYTVQLKVTFMPGNLQYYYKISYILIHKTQYIRLMNTSPFGFAIKKEGHNIVIKFHIIPSISHDY